MTAVRHLDGPDAGAVWHYGDPLREQRALLAGEASVDLSHRPLFAVSGPDRLTWLHAIASQDFASLAPGHPTSSYILNAQGHLTHVFGGVDDGETFWGHSEPGHLDALLAWLRRMIFAARVEVADHRDDKALVLPAGASGPIVVDRDEVDQALGERRAGTWAMEALRIASGVPRIFLDTDDKTIPNELANPDGTRLGPAVHLAKGCYPGQETVARVYNLGRPPRRLTLLHLDGSAERLPAVGADLLAEGRVVGRMGTSERHYELGPIGLALVKRTVAVQQPLVVDGIAAAQEVLVDPEVGRHWRPDPGLLRR
ncbi:MAG: folate-binding protein [Propionicimonas sp.]